MPFTVNTSGEFDNWFVPLEEALLLIGGNKAGDKRWYKRMIPSAEAIFERHLKTLEKGEDDGKTS